MPLPSRFFQTPRREKHSNWLAQDTEFSKTKCLFLPVCHDLEPCNLTLPPSPFIDEKSWAWWCMPLFQLGHECEIESSLGYTVRSNLTFIYGKLRPRSTHSPLPSMPSSCRQPGSEGSLLVEGIIHHRCFPSRGLASAGIRITVDLWI